MTEFWITTFPDLSGSSMRAGRITLDTLGKLIAATHAPDKHSLPLLKLARFGATRTANNSLRHDDNVLMVSGLEADYDGGTVPMDDAIKRLEAEDIAFIAYTTPSYTVAAPRWRLVLPFTKEHKPAERSRMENRLNGLLGGILAKESWNLSQGYFFGRVDGAVVDFDIRVYDSEKCIDDADDLDPTAQPFRPGVGGRPPPPGRRAPPRVEKSTSTRLTRSRFST